MKLYDRYIMLETLQVLAVGTFAIIGIFYGTAEFKNVLDMTTASGLSLQTVLLIMVLQLPTGMVCCLPSGVVMAVMLVLIRSSRDCEVMALQLLGVPLLRVLAPFLVMGFLSSSAAFVISEYAAPQCRDLARRLFIIAANKAQRPFPDRSELRLEEKSSDGRVVSTSKIIELGKEQIVGADQGKKVSTLVCFDLTNRNGVKLVYAGSAQWLNCSWTLHDGKIFEFFDSTEPLSVSAGSGVQMQFQSMQLPFVVQSDKTIGLNFKTTMDKTSGELLGNIKLLQRASVAVPPFLALQYHRRFAYPLSCFFLVIAAAPMVFFRKRKGADFSLIYGGFLIVSFFLLQEISMALAVNGRIDGTLAAYLPLIMLTVLGSLSAILLRRA
jgi:lipopolysaccharide export LptBFGC system permease protein LptF